METLVTGWIGVPKIGLSAPKSYFIISRTFYLFCWKQIYFFVEKRNLAQLFSPFRVSSAALRVLNLEHPWWKS